MTFTSSNLMVISPNRGPDEKGIVTKSGAGRPTSGPGPNRGPDEKGIVTEHPPSVVAIVQVSE